MNDKKYLKIGVLMIMAMSMFACASNVTRGENFSESYLLNDMPEFSLEKPIENIQARKWYFRPYYQAINDVNIYSGYYISDEEVLVAHMLEGPDTSLGTVILIHGYNGSVLNLHFQYFAKKFVSDGYRVILLNIPGHGFSGGVRGNIKDFSQYRNMLRDFLLLTDGQRGPRTILIGHSVGAISIYDFLANYPEQRKNITKAVLLAPFTDLEHSGLYSLGSLIVNNVEQEKTKVLRLSSVSSEWINKQRAWTKKMLAYDTLDWDTPMLIVFAEKDKVIRNKKAISYYQTHVKNKIIKIYPDEGHTFLGKEAKHLREETYEWVIDGLEKTSR